MIAMGMGLGLQPSNFVAQQVLNYQNRVIADGGELLLTQEEIMALIPLGDWSWFYVPSGRKAGMAYAQLPESNLGDLTVTRASVANEVSRAGVLSEVAANVGRLDFLNGVFQGQPIEPMSTNLARHSRDLTNSVWVRTNMNATRDEVGADGSANTATRLTATAANATILQSLTLASAQRTWSAWIRRVTGTGRIEMTMDGGASWVIVTSGITSSFTPISIPAQTLANNSVGFRIADSGDQIAVDFVQLESGAVRTSPIITGAATASRNADLISLNEATALIGQGQGTLFAELDLRDFANRRILNLSDGTSNNEIRINIDSSNFLQFAVLNAGVVQANIFISYIPGYIKLAAAYSANDFVFYVNGVAIGSDNSGSIPATSQINVGSNATGGAALNDRIRAAGISQRRWTNAELAQLTSL